MSDRLVSMLRPSTTDTTLKLLKTLHLSKNLAVCKGSRTGNTGNNLELKVLTQIQHVPWTRTRPSWITWAKEQTSKTSVDFIRFGYLTIPGKIIEDPLLRPLSSFKMVYAERTERHTSPTDQGNSNAANGKPHTEATKYSIEQRAASNSSTLNNWSNQKSSAEDKWKYNNMVRNDREKFNSLHFCWTWNRNVMLTTHSHPHTSPLV